MQYLIVLVTVLSLMTPVFSTAINKTRLEPRLPPYNPKGPKRGLPYSNVQYLRNFHAGGSQVSWAYNWDSHMDPAFSAALEYVPMLWSNQAIHTNNVSAELRRIKPPLSRLVGQRCQ